MSKVKQIRESADTRLDKLDALKADIDRSKQVSEAVKDLFT